MKHVRRMKAFLGNDVIITQVANQNQAILNVMSNMRYTSELPRSMESLLL